MAVLKDLISRIRSRVHDVEIGTATITAATTTAYSSPDSSSDIIGEPESGDVFGVLSRDGIWLGILLLGERAYIDRGDASFSVDLGEKPIYAQYKYEEAIGRGLGRINTDLKKSYTLPTLPAKYEYLAELRGTIEMCLVRAGEGATGNTGTESQYQSVTVPNFSVSKVPEQRMGPKYWFDLAMHLENEYEKLLDDILYDEADRKTVQSAIMFRTSRTTGRRTNRVMDSPLPPAEPAISESGGVVSLVWEPTKDVHFREYRVLRSESADFTEFEIVRTIYDNHRSQSSDSPGSGTWFYRVDVVNSQRLVSESEVLTVTV